ncbi:hypothetical protein KAR91_28105 [Candidatus Pacearchaeota archaeon]|nr:hypothetical protein [Candidatus Pacearchaeota archaeon]
MFRNLILMVMVIFFITACGPPAPPSFRSACDGKIQYRWTGGESIIIKYQGQQYNLEMDNEVPAPFRYEWEDDGDLDLYIVESFQECELDNPWDWDIDIKTGKRIKKKKAILKPVVKKTTSTMTKKKTTAKKNTKKKKT